MPLTRSLSPELDVLQAQQDQSTFDVPEHLLERSRVRREHLGTANRTSAHTAFLDPTTAALLAEEANGGVCAMAVANIVVELSTMRPTRAVSEYFDPHSGQIRPNTDSVEHKKKTGLFRSETTYVDIPRSQPEFIPAMERSGSLGDIEGVLHGINCQLGFFRGDFGVLTIIEDTTSFVPLVSFVDRRNASDDAGICSYATFQHSLLPCEVQIKTDETLPLGEFDKASGEMRVAKTVLDEISALQESIKAGDSIKNAEASGRLFAYLNVLDVIRGLYRLDTQRDYRDELYLRKVVAMQTAATAILHQELIDNELQGTSGDWLESIVYEQGQDTHGLKLNISYPNARDKGERTLVVATLGERLGSMTIDKASELAAYTNEDLAAKIANRLRSTSGDTQQQRGLTGAEYVNHNTMIISGTLQSSEEYHAIDAEQRMAAKHIGQELTVRYGLDPTRLRIVSKREKLSMRRRYSIVYQGLLKAEQYKQHSEDVVSNRYFDAGDYRFSFQAELDRALGLGLNDGICIGIGKDELWQASDARSNVKLDKLVGDA